MTTVALHEPAHREALWELEAAFDRGDVVTVYGTCTVEYDGRAASSLAEGRRLLLLKPDGTALVHTDEGHEPVNWQPPGSHHRAAVRDGRLRVRCTRESPEERLDVQFTAVNHLVSYPVSGRRSVEVIGTEADLKRRLVDDPELIEPGFSVTETERPTDAGAVDVFGTDADGRPTVVELKRRRVGPDAVGQLRRYVAAVQRATTDGDESVVNTRDEVTNDTRDEVTNDTRDEVTSDTRDGSGEPRDTESGFPPVRGILVSPSVTDRAADLLAEEGLEHVALDPPAAGTRVPSDTDEDVVVGDTDDAEESGDETDSERDRHLRS